MLFRDGNSKRKKLGLRYEARVQREMYEELFENRLKGKKLYINKAMEESFLDSKDAKDKKAAKLIRDWHSAEITRLEEELFKQSKRLADAKRVLKSNKPTKKAQNDERIATDKNQKIKRDLGKHKKLEPGSESDHRIFPLHYVSMLTIDENGERIIMPVRYLMRPAGKDESFDREFSGCYNARFDNLARVEFWKNALTQRRGIIFVKKFYENVDPKVYAKKNKLSKEDLGKSNIVLCFEPDDTDVIIIPTIWDVWKKKGEPTLYSGALITDEPAPEIAAAGHDRTPIFLKESAIDNWLNAKGSIAEIKDALSARETPHYSHLILKAG